jgi:excinuclease UvrABC nuclease subunit
MKSTSFFAPYEGKRRCKLKKTGCGVYVIKKRENIVYVGMSKATLKETLYRHFQQWTDNRNGFLKTVIMGEAFQRVTYKDENLDNFKVKVIFCKNPVEAANLEMLLIKKFKPKDNENKYQQILFSELSKTEKDFKNSEFISINDEDYF